MLKIHLDLNKLQHAVGADLKGQTINYGGVLIGCNIGTTAAAGYHLYHIKRARIDAVVPDTVKTMVDFFCYEEEIAGPGKQWRHGHYRHRDTGDADAFFDGVGDSCTLKMRSTNQADLIALHAIVLQVKPGNRNRIDGLIEPPCDDWNAGYEASMKETEAAHRAEVMRLEGEIERLQKLLGKKQSVQERARVVSDNIRGQLKR